VVKISKFEIKTERPLEDAKKAMEKWSKIWDSGKYEESYDKLAEFTRKNLSREFWSVYWKGTRKPLGKVKSRKLISYEYVNSMQGIPDQAGMIYQFQSSFKNADNALETIALIREKDGIWRVSNYLTNQEPKFSE
jgi:hypothetical protein